MAYVADDFAYIARRLKEIRGNVKLPAHPDLRDREELPRQQRPGVVADDMWRKTTTNHGGLLRR